MKSITFEAAIVITGISKRTLWRRVSDGVVRKVAEDVRGRAMLAFDDVVPLICLPVQADDLQMILRADGGDASAQADVGEMFYLAGNFEAAVYWLTAAASQEQPDAMQWLGICYAAGNGVPVDDNLAISWIARAAAKGHLIAAGQMKSMHPIRGAV